MHLKRQRPGYTMKQLLLTIGVVAVMIRLALIAVPGPNASTDQPQADSPAEVDQPSEEKVTPPVRPNVKQRPDLPAVAQQPLPSVVEVLPFNLQGHIPAPLLASILREHRPELTDQHAGHLMDTLPPGATQRMIVILPEEAEVDETF